MDLGNVVMRSVSAASVGTPDVSVVLAFRNPGASLEATIDSVRNQSLATIEIICVDDGSSDDSGLLVAAAREADPRIRLLTLAESVGLTRALNHGIAAGTGRVIARVDAGDTMAPLRLERQLQFLDANPDVLLCGTQSAWTFHGAVVGQTSFPCDDPTIRRFLRQRRGVLLHPTVMFRNDGVVYDERFRYSQDLALYIALSHRGKLACLPETLTTCAVDPDGITVTKKYFQRQYIAQAFALLDGRSVGRGAGEEFAIRDWRWERRLCDLSMRLFVRYMRRRSSGEAPASWLPWLAIALLVYPPLAKDYLVKVAAYLRHR